MSTVAVPEASELAWRYYRSGNVLWVVELVLSLALPAALLFTGLSARLRTMASAVGRGHFCPTIVAYLALVAALLFLVQLPLTVYVGYAREHAYGLSTQRVSKFAADQLKGLAVGLLLGALVLWVPFWLLARSPDRWWLWTGALALPFYTLVLLVTPVHIAPLFNKFGPMKDKALESQVLAVAAQAATQGGTHARHSPRIRKRRTYRPEQLTIRRWFDRTCRVWQMPLYQVLSFKPQSL